MIGNAPQAAPARRDAFAASGSKRTTAQPARAVLLQRNRDSVVRHSAAVFKRPHNQRSVGMASAERKPISRTEMIRRTVILQAAAGERDDTFLHYLYGMVIHHLE